MYIWHMIALIGFGGHSHPYTKNTSQVLLCVSISMTSQAQLATISPGYFCCK